MSILLSIIGIIILLNLIFPLLIYLTMRLPDYPEVVSIVSEQQSPELIKEKLEVLTEDEAIQGYYQDLKALGFKEVSTGLATNPQNIILGTLLVHPSEKHLATVMKIIENNGKVNSYLEFSYPYNQRFYNISNTTVTDAYPETGLRYTVQFPEADSNTLYSVFTKAAALLPSPSDQIDIDKKNPFKIVNDFLGKEHQYLIDNGYISEKLTELDERKLTLKGAYYMTLKFLFPGNFLIKNLRKQKQNKLLKQIENNQEITF